MEDRRTAIALFLIFIVVMLYSELVLAPYSKPQHAPAAPTPQVQQQQAFQTPAVSQLGAPAQVPSEAAVAQPALVPQHVTPAELRESQTTEVDTGSFVATITHLGARFSSLKLHHYREQVSSQTPLDLIVTTENAPLPLGIHVGSVNDEHTQYSLVSASSEIKKERQRFVLSPGQELRLSFRGQLGSGQTIEKSFVFRENSYLFSVESKLDRPASDGSSLWLEWSYYLPETLRKDQLNPHQFTTLDQSRKIRHTAVTELQDRITDPVSAVWTAFNDRYFTATLIPSAAGLNSRLGKEGSVYLQRVRGSDTAGTFTVYAGPKDYEILLAAGFELQRSIDLGFFSFIGYPLLLLLKLFFQFIGNYGLAIVLLTLFIKALFFPLTKASLNSMKAMQQLQPEMKALRERIKDPNQLNQEVLALYKKHGVNPMGGCFPILIQIPVFFGLYSALQNSIELRHAPYALWVHDLSSPEGLELFGIRVPLLIVLMGVLMLYQQYITPNPSADPSQRKTMWIMTGVFVIMFIVLPLPAGLALYMLVNTAISIVQQYYLRIEGGSPFRGTLLASVAIFFVAFIATLV